MERILHKIGRIREYARLINSIRDDCTARFTNDPLYRGALLHYLYLLADSCIALSELVIKYKKLRLPQTYYEAFDILGENKVLEPGFAFSFARIAGFRNFLAQQAPPLQKTGCFRSKRVVLFFPDRGTEGVPKRKAFEKKINGRCPYFP